MPGADQAGRQNRALWRSVVLTPRPTGVELDRSLNSYVQQVKD